MGEIYDWGEKPNPGSDRAQEQGCICAVLDNNHGRGVGTPAQFWITEGCPIHAASEVPSETSGEQASSSELASPTPNQSPHTLREQVEEIFEQIFQQAYGGKGADWVEARTVQILALINKQIVAELERASLVREFTHHPYIKARIAELSNKEDRE